MIYHEKREILPLLIVKSDIKNIQMFIYIVNALSQLETLDTTITLHSFNSNGS